MNTPPYLGAHMIKPPLRLHDCIHVLGSRAAYRLTAPERAQPWSHSRATQDFPLIIDSQLRSNIRLRHRMLPQLLDGDVL